MFECVIKQPSVPAEYCIIWLHGLGADGNDFADIVPYLNLPSMLAVRFIFPHAPIRSVTINGGMACRAWFDIYDLERLSREDEQGIKQSSESLIQMIDQQVEQGINPRRIMLVGFSQGGALAQYVALTSRYRLAGMAGLSTYLPLSRTLKASEHSKDLPAFLAHGQHDPVVPMSLGQDSVDLLGQLGCQVSWFDYAMDHTVCPQELNDISQWITKVFTSSF